MRRVRRFSGSLPSGSGAPPGQSTTPATTTFPRAMSQPNIAALPQQGRSLSTTPVCSSAGGRRPSWSHCSSTVWQEQPLSGDALDTILQSFERKRPTPLTMEEILEFDCPYRMAKFVLREMPIRLAYRVRLIESLPPQWKEIDKIVQVYELLQSYLGMLLVQHVISTDEDLQCFRSLVRHMNRVNSVPLLTAGAFELRQLTGQEFLASHADVFLNDFFLSRISTELLSLHFLALYENPAGFVNPVCDPVLVCETARDSAADLCRHHYGYAPQVEVQYVGQAEHAKFAYITSFLYYIVYELMKNSFRAVVERDNIIWIPGKIPTDLVTIVVNASSEDIRITVADKGYGIPAEVLPNIWSYSYTTAGRDAFKQLHDHADEFISESAQGGQIKLAGSSTVIEQDGSQRKSKRVSPIAGFGVGAPLARLYAEYLGGSLVLDTTQGEGTVAALVLKRASSGSGEHFESAQHKVVQTTT